MDESRHAFSRIFKQVGKTSEDIPYFEFVPRVKLLVPSGITWFSSMIEVLENVHG